MSAALVSRLLAAAGLATPPGVLARTLARAPRARLVRAIAWLGCATASGATSDVLIRGVRLVVRGWDDVFATTAIPRDAPLADIERPTPGRALAIRAARVGRGWQKEARPTLGAVRPEVELAVAWLSHTVGCILHDDCAAIPELGAACAGAG